LYENSLACAQWTIKQNEIAGLALSPDPLAENVHLISGSNLHS
jgi:hypothetical protein